MKKALTILGYLTAVLAVFLSFIIASYTLNSDVTPLTQDDKFYLRMLTIYMGMSILISAILFYIRRQLFNDKPTI